MAARVETEIVIEPSSPHAGEPCTFCGQPVHPGQRAVLCPRCRALHHSECWKRNGGCARRGCRQLAVAVREEQKRSEGEPVPPAWWQRHPLAAGAVALVVIAAAGIGLGLRIQEARNAPPVTRIMTWADAGQQAALEEALAGQTLEPAREAAAQAAAEGARAREIRVEVAPLVAYEQKLLILVAARDAPDVYALPADRLRLYAEQGALVDLTQLWERDSAQDPELAAAVPRERLREEGSVDGRIYGLPHPFSTGVLVLSSTSPSVDSAWEALKLLIKRFPAPPDPPALPAGGLHNLFGAGAPGGGAPGL